MRPARTGYTLIEVMITLVVFSVMLTIALEALSGVRQYVNTASLEDSLAAEADRIFRVMTEDLGNSAWWINEEETDLVDLATDASYDRNGARYYPYVIAQDYASATAGDPEEININGVPDTSGWYQDFIRGDDEIVTPAHLASYKPNLPATHRAYSQELIFLRVHRGNRSDDPRDAEADWIDFDADAAPMAAFSNPQGIPTSRSLLLSKVDTGTVWQVDDVPLQFEAAPGADIWDAANNVYDNDALRHFTYALLPDASAPGGTMLVRAHLDEVNPAPAGAVTDMLDELLVLSRDVDRIMVDTYRTDASLAFNQVRVRLWLSRRDRRNPSVPVTHHAEATIALRSTVDPEYSVRLSSLFGQAGDFSIP